MQQTLADCIDSTSNTIRNDAALRIVPNVFQPTCVPHQDVVFARYRFQSPIFPGGPFYPTMSRKRALISGMCPTNKKFYARKNINLLKKKEERKMKFIA